MASAVSMDSALRNNNYALILTRTPSNVTIKTAHHNAHTLLRNNDHLPIKDAHHNAMHITQQ